MQEEISVIYQDDAIIVVDKPVNLPVHKNDFMPNDAPYLTKLLGDQTGKWIYNVHRLDSKTSGVIVLTFSSEYAKNLTMQFERKEVAKTYFAVVQGKPGEGTFEKKVLVKKKGKFKKSAVTNYQTIKTFTTALSYKEKENVELSWVRLIPETGRWHQLRQHCAQHHHDILGDTHHGDFTLNKIITEKTGLKRLFLHAGELEFDHPETNERLKFTSELPQEFEKLEEFLNKGLD